MRQYKPPLNGTIPVDHPRMVRYITQYKLDCWDEIVAKLENIGLVNSSTDPHTVFSVVESLIEGNLDLIGRDNVSVDGVEEDAEEDAEDDSEPVPDTGSEYNTIQGLAPEEYT
jgi:hypothetical protein